MNEQHQKLRGQLNKLNTFDIAALDGVYYSEERYGTLIIAQDGGAVRVLETVYGFMAIVSALQSMIQAVDVLQHKAGENDIRIRATLNETIELPEMYLSELLDFISDIPTPAEDSTTYRKDKLLARLDYIFLKNKEAECTPLSWQENLRFINLKKYFEKN